MSVSDRPDYHLLLPSDFPDIKNLTKSAALIALSNFEWRFITFVLFNSSILYEFDIFSRVYRKSVIVGHDVFYPRFAENTHQYILFGIDISNISQMLEWMQTHQFDNTGKYVIACLSKEDCDETNAVKILWNYKIVNVVFLKLDSLTNEVVAYSYFNNYFDCTNIQPEKLNNWLTCIYDNFEDDCLELFPLKLRNLQLCPITVSTFTQRPYMIMEAGVPSGVDGDLLRLISEKLNTTLTITTPHRGFGWGNLEEDGTWSGSLADVYYDLANFSMTSASITLSRFSHFQMSMGYNTVNVVWVTHPSALESPSLKLLRPFESQVRIAVLLSFILVVILTVLMKFNYRNSVFKIINIPRPRRSLVFYSWELCMGLPSTKLPTKSAFLHIVLFWIWYCFLIRTFYTVFLIKALKTSKYYSDLQTIEDAIEANYSIGGGPALKDYYVDEPAIYNQWVNLESNEIISAMANVSEGLKFVIAMNLETSKIFQRNHSWYLHILPQKVISSPTVIFFKKFSPLKMSINAILTQLIESGFTSKFYENYTKPRLAKRSGRRQTAITLVHFTGCYAVIISGWIASFISFIIELYVGRPRKLK